MRASRIGRVATSIGLLGTMGVLAMAQPSSAATTSITSATGPLTSIAISDELNCAVSHIADAQPEFYGTTACGTLIAADDTLWGPTAIPAGGDAAPRQPYSLVSQSPVSGAGTTADPFAVTTVVHAGNLQISETDSYVVGDEFYRTDVRLSQVAASTSSINATVFRGGDCFLQNSDYGFGLVDEESGAVACQGALVDDQGQLILDANNLPQRGARLEQWIPLTDGSHYMEANFNEVWARIGSRIAFPDTCRCDEHLDNGAGLSWDVSVPAVGSVTVSHLTNFSPTGSTPLNSPPVAVDQTVTTTPNTAANFTVGASDPDVGDVLTFDQASAPSHGTLSQAVPGSAAFTYTPANGYTGADQALITVSDGHGGLDVATITFDVVGQLGTVLVANPSIASLTATGLQVNLTLSAKLTTTANVPIAGQSIRMSAAGRLVCTAVTNPSGVAACGGILPGVLASILSGFGYDATYAGTPTWAPAAAHGALLVVRLRLF